MTLKERLSKIAAASAKQIPSDAQLIMNRETQLLSDSISGRSIPRVGDLLPTFELPDSTGNAVSSAMLAGEGPFVVTFFRGTW